MSVISKEGFVALRVVYGIAVIGLILAALLVVGSYTYWQLEKKNDQVSTRQQGEARNRLAKAKQQRDDVRDSAQTYQALTKRGVFVDEARLDLIEALAALKSQHRLATLEYEVLPQRPLVMKSGASFGGVKVLASRVKLKASAENDADLVAFLDAIPNLKRGVFPLDKCVLQRDVRAEAVGARAETAAPPAESPKLKADCELEWITLQAAPTAPVAVPPARASGR